MDQRLQAAAAAFGYRLSMRLNPPAIVLLLWAWGCAGVGKPGPEGGGETGDKDGGPADGVTRLPDGVPDDLPRVGSDSDDSDESGGWVDTGPPVDIELLADNDPASTGWSSYMLSVSGTAEIADDGSMAGTIDYATARDGGTVCDVTVALTGLPDDDPEGLCDGCDYDFAVDAEVIEDHSGLHCELNPGWTFVLDDFDGFYINPHMAFADEMELYGWYYERTTYDNVWLTGIGFDYSARGGVGYYPGPYFHPYIFDGPVAHRGSAELDGDTLNWEYYFYGTGLGWLNHYEFCNTMVDSDATEPYDGTMVSGDVDCANHYMDGWTVEAHPGDTISLRVDAPDRSQIFAPEVFVNGPDGCAIVHAFENVYCTTTEDWSLLCAAARFTVEEEGTHEIWVYSSGYGCHTTLGIYDLYVDIDPAR